LPRFEEQQDPGGRLRQTKRSTAEQEAPRPGAPMLLLEAPRGPGEEAGPRPAAPAAPLAEEPAPRLSARERWVSAARGRAVLRAEKESMKSAASGNSGGGSSGSPGPPPLATVARGQQQHRS
jgi:hypothetical protein